MTLKVNTVTTFILQLQMSLSWIVSSAAALQLYGSRFDHITAACYTRPKKTKQVFLDRTIDRV